MGDFAGMLKQTRAHTRGSELAARFRHRKPARTMLAQLAEPVAKPLREHVLTLLLMGTALAGAFCVPATFAAATAEASSNAEPLTDNATIEGLQQRLRELSQKLDGLRDAGTATPEPFRRHWREVQDYGVAVSRAAAKVNAGQNPALPQSGSACELPQQFDPTRYAARMDGLLLNWREALIALHQAPANRPNSTRGAMLARHANAVANALETLRVQTLLHGSAAPVADTARVVPEAASESAYLVSLYCTQCHALPSPQLHTAAEWLAVSGKMREHMQLANGDAAGTTVQLPSESERLMIERYLQDYACTPKI